MLDTEEAANTLHKELALKRVDADDFYEVMDVLVEYKTEIQKGSVLSCSESIR